MRKAGGGDHGRDGCQGGDVEASDDTAVPSDAPDLVVSGAPPCPCGMHVSATEVPTGQVQAASHGVLRVSALGSCVAVVAWDSRTGRGGIAHIMLPGSAPQGRAGNEKSRYCEDGIEALLSAMARDPHLASDGGSRSSPRSDGGSRSSPRSDGGSRSSPRPDGAEDEPGLGVEPTRERSPGPEPEGQTLSACLVGAGNVLCRVDGSLCHANFQSVTQALWRRGIPVLGCHVGGTERRSVTFDLDKGCVYFTKSSFPPKLLCRFSRTQGA